MLSIAIIACALNSRAQEMKQPRAKSCEQIVSTRSGIGPRYAGTIRNDDYDFTARIPQGFTGWGGVASDAPFHGFTIFLDPKGKSCIIFEVHIQGTETGITQRPIGSTAISLGKARGWRTEYSGLINGVRFINDASTFSFEQPDQIDNGEILLVTPASGTERAMRVYDSFLTSVQFGHSLAAR